MKHRTLVSRAYAKVNLDLRVLGTRPDGFHELRTVFQAIELHDTLTWTERPGPFTVKCRTPGVPTDDSNLVWQAADRLWKALGRGGRPRDAVVTIDKQIPLQAGLGGGSADAAAALLALARLWGGAPLTLLREVGTSIGADVSFFFREARPLAWGLARRSTRSSIFPGTGLSSFVLHSGSQPQRHIPGTTTIGKPG